VAQEALRIAEATFGAEHLNVATSLNNLAGLYLAQGKYAEAEPLHRRALAIREKVPGPEHPDGATALSYLARVYQDQGKYAEAEPLYRRALRILEKALGPEHPDMGTALQNLGLLKYGLDRPDEAEPPLERSLHNLARQFEYHFTYMSENERLGFLDTVAGRFSTHFNFCLTYRERDPALIGKMYDVLLWQKGFVAQSIAALRTKIQASQDPQALEQLDKLTAKKTQLARLLTAEPKDRTQWRKDIEQLEQEANELERELVKRSTAMAEEKRLARVTWRDVQKGLAKDEAAVELVKFQFHDGKRWTHKSNYVALIVTAASTTAATLVLLGEAEKLEGGPLQEYRKLVGLEGGAPAAANRTAYEAFWKPLETPLAESKRVYLSPDGLLNQVSFGVLPTADDRLMLEKYDLRLLSSTKGLLREKRAAASKLAVLIGNPRFDLAEPEQRVVARNMRKAEQPETLVATMATALRSRDQGRGTLAPLPATKVGLEAIRALLVKQGWQVEVYGEANALEEAVKGVKGPRVLHVATHGFFLADQQVKPRSLASEIPSGREDPMLRAGLFFAGANRVISSVQSSPDIDDGVLTAYEASGLNLQGTELVVLSACETGLSEVRNGEGVFGLRRALQEAGAESVLMSLWEVADRETQELMTLFYDKWLSGMSKHEALRQAQLELRAKVKARYGQDLPLYWAAFVLVGH
jgi:CHAT domain-containing protein